MPDTTDIKYPTYLRTILPESIKKSLVWVSVCQDDSSESAYVCASVRINSGSKKATTYLFKDNLVGLQASGKSGINYISWDDHSPLTKEIPELVTIYCELRPLIWFLDDPLQFPSLPPIHIDTGTVGIRDEEIKQLLRDYLSLRPEEFSQSPSDSPQIDYEQIDPLSLNDAGYLICGLKPLPPVRGKLENDPDKEIRHMASARIGQLINDAKAGKLKVETSDGEDAITARDRKPEGRFGKDFWSHYGTQWFVTRNDLKDWAVKKGLRPAFLFPEIESSKVNSETPGENAKVSSQLNSQEAGSQLGAIENDKVDRQEADTEIVIPNDTELPNDIQQKIQCNAYFDESDCSLFDPMNRKQIVLLFTSIPEDEWKKSFNRANRTPLKFARHGNEKPYKYNPAKIANWLHRNGKYSSHNLARVLVKNLPSRSKEQREDFMEKYELHDRYS